MLTEQNVIEIINELDLGFKLDSDSTPADAPLKSLGVDSLDIYNILVELENKTGKAVPDSDVENLSTIKEIAAYFS
jgi:acyl carrier protein